MQGTTNIVKDIWLAALQIAGYHGNDIIGSTRVDINKDGQGYTTNTKSTGIATFTDLVLGTYTIEISKDGYNTITDTISISNPFNYVSKEMTPVILTFTITDENNQPIPQATIILGTTNKTTDENGQAQFIEVLDGNYTYSISKESYDTESGTITISRTSQSISTILYPAPVDALARNNFVANDNVKLNIGVGNSSYIYEAEPENSANINVLSINGVAKTSAQTLEVVKVRPSFDNANITIIADEDNVNFELNNENDVIDVKVNIQAISKFLCFKNGSDYIYFENNTLPFLPNSKSFTQKQYKYFTYSDNVMTAHTATTSTVNTDGANSFDGHTLNIDSSDNVSSKVWQRHSSGDIELDNSSDIIFASEGYLTDVNPIIPNNYKKLTVSTLDSSIWRQILVVNGVKIENFPDGYNLWVKSGYNFSITSVKKNSALAKDCYTKLFSNITNHKIVEKLVYTLNTNVAGCTIKLWVGDATQKMVLFETTGSTANIQGYTEDIIYYEVSHAGYTTKTGSYTITKGGTYTQNITLVAE